MRHSRFCSALSLGLLLLTVLAACGAGQPPASATPHPNIPVLLVVDIVADPSLPQGAYAEVVGLAPSSGGVLWRHRIDTPTFVPLVQLDGIAFASSLYSTATVNQRGVLEALAPATGALLWRHETDQPLSAQPAVVGGVVYVSYNAVLSPGASSGPGGGFVEALRESDGKTLWKSSVFGSPSPPTLAGGSVYVATSNSSLVALNTSNGTQLWTAPTDLPLTGEHGPIAPVVAGGGVYLNTISRDSSGGAMVALDAYSATDGHQIWQHPTTGIASPPVVVNGVVYLAWYTQSNAPNPPAEALALDAATGAVRWRYPLPGLASSPTISHGTMYLIAWVGGDASTSEVFALRMSDGTLLWKAPDPRSADADGVIPPVVTNGGVAVQTYSASQPPSVTLTLLNAQTGQPIWHATINGIVQSPPSSGDGAFYVISEAPDYALFAFRAGDGTLLWRHPLRS